MQVRLHPNLYNSLNYYASLNTCTILYTLPNGAEDPMVIILTFKIRYDPDQIAIRHSSEEGCLATKMSQTLRGIAVKKLGLKR